MSYTYSLGRNLATNDATTGQPGVISGVGEQRNDYLSRTVTVRGPLAALEGHVPSKGTGHADCGWVPDGYFVDDARLTSANGEATITLQCVAPGADSQASSAAPTLIQYQVLMSEVQLDLITHPDITSQSGAVDLCLKWLATDVTQRIGNGTYYWVDVDGSRQEITGAALKFCEAYMHGIKTYNRYYPIIDKQSFYRRVPGLTLGTAQTPSLSVTGGTARFSADIGTFSAPDISLNGYAATGWFKSGDEYRTSGRGFMRSEQWTWTPDGSGSQFAWIYGGSVSSSSNS